MTDIQAPAQAWTGSEELAYMLLEEARLRCRALVDEELAVGCGPGSAALDALHGELGIAGYYASARLEPERRRQLLAQAHYRSQLPRGGAAASVGVLVNVTGAATRTVERALTTAGLLDHMHLAHMHALSACEALDSMSTVPA